MQELQQRLSKHVPLDYFEATPKHVDHEVLKVTDLMQELQEKLPEDTRRAMQDFGEATSSYLHRHGALSKEHAKKLEQLLEFRDQSQELHRKLQLQLELRSSEATSNLAALRETLNESCLELKSLVSECNEHLGLAIRHVQDLQQKFSTNVHRNDLDALQKHVDGQILNVSVLVRELQTKLPEDTRKEMQALREAVSTDMQGHGEVTKEHAKKLEHLLEFRNHSHDLHKNQASELQGHAEAIIDHANQIDELMDLKYHMQDLQQQLSINVSRQDLDAMREHVDKEVLKITVFMQELQPKLPEEIRKELQDIMRPSSFDAQRHGEITKDNGTNLEQLLHFSGQSEALHQNVQLQQEDVKGRFFEII